MRTYHGWLLVEARGAGYNDAIKVEYTSADGKRRSKDFGYGQGGCVDAIEWWDSKIGAKGAAKLEPTLKGMYRVYTEAT